MSKREEAGKFLEDLYSCIPRFFYSEIESTKRGFGFLLSYLEQADKEVYAGELSKKLNVSTARIAALLKRMEQDGLITRHTLFYGCFNHVYISNPISKIEKTTK